MTLTVAQLIAELQKYEPNTPVYADVIDGKAGVIADIEHASDGDHHELYLVIKEDA